ncbi:GNAT family N-acetyltransferase [Oerskovia flava]|uniref:GNAT family N-acetyltransferase n=1 Tax=Oerskovia flava TaxID=2986422 RepID=UPI00223FDBE8|nr:GNAT family N-acetyltransferase [Oerskovia sp. JB1-3-2]
MEPFTLDAGDVHLSTPTSADVDRITQVCQDPDVARWTVVPAPYTRDDAVGFVDGYVTDGWAKGNVLTWAVRDRAAVSAGTPAPVLGMIGLGVDDAPVGQQSAEIGYWLAPEARGRGLMTTAGRAVVDCAFDELGLAQLSWQAYVGNWPSRRTAWRLGFRIEGTVRGFALQRGRRRDAWLGTLLADDPREPVEPWAQVETHERIGR